MKIKGFEFNMFGEMTYVVYNETSGDAAVVDPGMLNAEERARLLSFIEQNNLSVGHIIATHIHLDHIFGFSALSGKFGVGLSANKADEFLGEGLQNQIRQFHIPVNIAPIEISQPLKSGDKISLGNEDLIVLEVPGHSPGSIALYSPDGGFVVTGDALFRGSIGRTDLPGGDYATLIGSITRNLLSLPEETVVYPGHGPSTTIAQEKASNPFL